MKILNFGSCNIDFVYSLDHIVEVGETETTHKLETFSGGKGLNQSIAAARAGAEVYHAGCIGTDGGMLREVLCRSGVDVSYLKAVDAKNGHAIIQVSSQGENSIFLYPGSNEMITCDFIDEVLESFSPGDFLLLQNEINNVEYIVKKAFEKRMIIILNPSPINEKINEIDFNMLSYIILNEVEARAITGSGDPKEGLEYFKSRYPKLKVMLTLGGNGCIYSDGNTRLYQPAFRVEAVDTTAAGDTFTGYFVEGISSDRSCSETLRIASAAAAIAVSRNGAEPSIPEREEVLKAVGSLKSGSLGNRHEILRMKLEEYLDLNVRTAKLDELAGVLGYSPVYTGNLVKKLTGKTFSALLQDKRCSTAAKLLLETDLSVEEIISRIGYENQSFFRRIFKEKYGKAPLAFRKI